MQRKNMTSSLGRILIDIPSDFVLTSSKTEINDDEIRCLCNFSIERIQFEFDKCVADFKCAVHLESNAADLLISSFNLPNGGKAVMGWEHPYAVSAAMLTCWFVSTDGGIYSWKTYVSPEHFEKVEYVLTTLSNSIIKYSFHGQLPTSFGFCFDGGFLQLQRDAIKEKINNVFILHSLWILEVKTSSGYDRKNYFDRFGPDYVEEARREGIYVFRYANRNIGNFEGQEICFLDPGESIADKASYDFQLYIPEKIGEITYPEVAIKMYTDVDEIKQNKFSDEEALSLWDSIVSTIRVRRGAL